VPGGRPALFTGAVGPRRGHSDGSPSAGKRAFLVLVQRSGSTQPGRSSGYRGGPVRGQEELFQLSSLQRIRSPRPIPEASSCSPAPTLLGRFRPLLGPAINPCFPVLKGRAACGNQPRAVQLQLIAEAMVLQSPTTSRDGLRPNCRWLY
jgi:hypothetical protein